MPPELRDKDLSVLQIDRSLKQTGAGRKPAKALASGAIAIAVLIGAGAILTRLLANVPTVEVARVAVDSSSRAGPVALTAGGYIVAHHTIDVSSKVVGKVVWVGVEKGDRVSAGQVLVRLDDTDYRAQLNQAQANLAAAEANLTKLEAGSRPQEILEAQAAVEQAQAEFDHNALILRRTEELFRQNISSQADLDNARAQYDMSQAKLESARQSYQLIKIGPRQEDIGYARAQVEQARAAVAYAQTQLDATRIRAPVSGTVLERQVEVGELVSNMNFGGTGGVKASVVSLADLNDLQVELDINETDFPKISPRQDCRITADSYPDRVYRGVVAEIAPEADRQKGTIQVKVKVLRPDDYLRPQMSAHVSFLAPETGRAAPDVLTIPRAALIEKEGHAAVFVYDGGRVALKSIRVGRNLSDGVEVVDGLGPNDRVVVKGIEGLKSGQRVKLRGA